MQISQDMLNKLSQMNNEQLKKAIGEVADALGASPAQKRMAQNNAGFIKRKITHMSEHEMTEYMSKVSPEKAEELKKKLGL